MRVCVCVTGGVGSTVDLNSLVSCVVRAPASKITDLRISSKISFFPFVFNTKLTSEPSGGGGTQEVEARSSL